MKKTMLVLVSLLVLSVGCLVGGIAFCDWANAGTVRSNQTTSVLHERGR